ncbi:MAG: type 4a pilus biogenesis protein PilO [Deltaproteobacteria bacterium]|nr:type 4a pilus biogenesis protein PilO [Deltaproteobacteria bacterium]
MPGLVSKYVEEGKYLYLFFSVLLLVNVFINLVAVKPRWSEADKMRKEYLSLREEESQLRKNMHETIKLAESIRQARIDLKEFIDSLPPESATSKIRSELYRIARKSGISISSVKYSLPDYKNGDLVKYDISFPVSGSYRKIRRFIYRLESMPYLMSINGLALTSGKKRGVSVTIKISTYLKAGD